MARLRALVERGRREGWLTPYVPRDVDPGLAAWRRWQADFSGHCENPFTFSLLAYACADRPGYATNQLWVEVATRCRKCEPCRKGRRMFWMERAIEEYESAQRTWMGDLTASPEHHYAMEVRMLERLSDERIEIASLTDRQLFQFRAQEFGREITLWLKRVREAIAERNEGKRPVFRYLIVAERHEDDPESAVYGKPHFHFLLHEQPGSSLLCEPHERWHGRVKTNAGRWREATFMSDNSLVRKQWKLGFTRVELCSGHKAAWYVCKYVSEEMSSRPRASFRYGLEKPIIRPEPEARASLARLEKGAMPTSGETAPCEASRAEGDAAEPAIGGGIGGRDKVPPPARSAD